MTAAQQPLANPGNRRSMLLAGGGLGLAALVIGAAVAHWALLAVAGIVLAAVIGLILLRPELAVATLTAAFFFTSYLVRGQGLLTLDKAIGVLAVMAWILDWAVNRRPIVMVRQLWVLAAFLLWTGISVLNAISYRAALVTSLRYMIFATLYFLVIQTVRGDRRRADLLVQVITVAAAAASIIGLVTFFIDHASRATGPITDPNDFGFMLACNLPLVIYRLRWEASRWRKIVWALCIVLIVACTLATFSRSALAGLAAATVWAVATGRLRVRWLAGLLAAAAAVTGIALLVTPRLVRNDFAEKAHVATSNVDVRLGYYRAELSEWQHYPIAGVGPGNFVYRFYQFAPSDGQTLPFPSNVLTISGEEAYLVILAEQGAVGLVLFVTYLALSWADLRRRVPSDLRRDQLQGAIAVGFIVACIGALFLAEQYYPPLWFLPALGTSMAGGGAVSVAATGEGGAGTGARPVRAGAQE
jgi:putative inorganic carbon (hco3(-)) transporter